MTKGDLFCLVSCVLRASLISIAGGVAAPPMEESGEECDTFNLVKAVRNYRGALRDPLTLYDIVYMIQYIQQRQDSTLST